MENKKKFIPRSELMKNKDPNNLREKVRKFIPIDGKDALKTDAEMTEFILDNCEIRFTDTNTFFCTTDLMKDNYPQYFEVLQPRFKNEFEDFADKHYHDLINTKTLEMRFDFGHTCPNWKDVISLGFVGLKKRVEDAAKNAGDDAEKKDFSMRRFYNITLQSALLQGWQKKRKGRISKKLRRDFQTFLCPHRKICLKASKCFCSFIFFSILGSRHGYAHSEG